MIKVSESFTIGTQCNIIFPQPFNSNKEKLHKKGEQGRNVRESNTEGTNNDNNIRKY